MSIKLLTIGHSYVVALNRRLAHEMQIAGKGRFDVRVAAPQFYNGANDLRSIPCEPAQNEPCPLEMLRTYCNSRIHLFFYERRLKDLCSAADFVHCWEEPYIFSGAQICHATPAHVPVVFYAMQNQNKWYPPPFSWMERYCLNRAAGWIAPGQTVVDTLLVRGYAKRPHRLLPLGVAMDRFFPDPTARSAKLAELGWTAPAIPVVGYLGRFVEEKGLRLLTRALERMSVEWRALFVGGGPLESFLRGWAARFPDRVRVVTGVKHDDVPAVLNAMDMLCAPSQTYSKWREQQGRMLIEAFACGVPVIGSDSGEIPYVLSDAGVVIGENDEAGWTRAMTEMVQSPKWRHEFAERGLERARNTYAWSVIARQHLEFFQELMDVRK